MDNVTRLLMQGAAGAAGSKTYVDDVFSTFLYTANGSAKTINNGIDIAGEGGMVWFKSRTTGGSSFNNHSVVDTERVDSSGRGKSIYPNLTEAQYSPENTNNITTSFNSNGFTTGTNANNATNTQTVASWSFRKAPGFFDVVTYTGNGSNRTISHNLGSVPGCIMVKNTSSAIDWAVWHSGSAELDATNTLKLNTSATNSTNSTYFDNGSTPPTATNFTVHTSNRVNANGETYVAYIFANGGESGSYAGGSSNSTTAYVKGDGAMTTGSGLSMTTGPFSVSNTAVNFNGSNSPLQQPASWNTGNSNYTLECWFKVGSTAWSQNWSMLFSRWSGNRSIYLGLRNGGYMHYYNSLSSESSNVNVGWSQNTWHHVAIVREGTGSNETHMYLDGVKKHSWTDNTNVTNSTTPLAIGWNNQPVNTENLNGTISNLRITIGQALYTGNFTPATSNLTTTSQGAIASNVKFLGLNGGVMTSSDVVTSDPLASIFGEGEDQNTIKTGKYVGNASSNGPEVFLGWEPQWILIKNTLSSQDWMLFDSMRGISTGYDDAWLEPNTSDAEDVHNFIDLTPTGFKVSSSSALVNGSTDPMIYVAIRRPDGYVAKPPEVGTGVFAMDVAGSGSPAFDSGFPVDFALVKNPSTTDSWDVAARLIQTRNLKISTTAEGSYSSNMFDYNSSWLDNTSYNGIQSWMWKRGAGFDVVTYVGNSSGDTSGDSQLISHNFGKVPEMIWTKGRDGGSGYWGVYHKGLNGGTNPENYRMLLNDTHAQSDGSGSGYTTWYWNDTAPTATHFSVGEISNTNANNVNFIAMLFASVDGISKLGYYDGTGSAGHVITTGFTPRFLIIKTTNASNSWFMYDSLRGLGAGNDPYLQLENTNPQAGGDTFAISSTGFTINQTYSSVNASGAKYIYYAHA